jgi:hypothetical protein
MRFIDDHPLDALAVTVPADGALPAVFGVLGTEVAAVTVNLSVHFGHVAATGARTWDITFTSQADARTSAGTSGPPSTRCGSNSKHVRGFKGSATARWSLARSGERR